MQKNWKILIITNNTIISEYYRNDNCFNNENWTFFNVGKNKMTSDKFSVVNSCEIPNYEYLGKDWAESEVIYNISKLNLFSDVEYLGIVHYDFNLFDVIYKTYRITENIDNIININKKNWISFFSVNISNITGFYDVLMDDRKPNCLFVRDSNIENPKSCNDYIQQKFKESGIFNSDFDFHKLNSNFPLSLCCSFLTKRDTMMEIGNEIGKIKESKILDSFDTERRHRYYGQFMERLIAIYSLKMKDTAFYFRLDHRFTGGRELNKNDVNGENY